MIAGASAFISHAEEDADVARELCRELEAAGIACWIAPRDVTPGEDYAAEIVAGIESCSAFVLVLSSAANRSPFVRREVERAGSKHKPMFPVRVEDVLPQHALEFFVSSSHWIDALDAPRDAQWARLARAIKGERERAGAGPHDRAALAPRRRGRRARPLALGALGIVVAAAFVALIGRDAQQPAPRPAPPAPTATAPAAPAAPDLRGRAERILQLQIEGTPYGGRIAGAPAPDQPCPERLSGAADVALPLTCVCSGDAALAGTVWGSDVYTVDSTLCRAALHAGAIGREGGAVNVERAPGRDLYVGTLRRGVRTHDYGRYPESMRFAGVARPAAGPGPCPQRFNVNPDLASPFTCTCSADDVHDGSVWGSDLYTADSQLCRAALHAGAVGHNGGEITVERGPGRDLYTGTLRHGVRTADYGRFATSIHFAGTRGPPPVEPCPQRLSVNLDLPTPHSCVCDADAVQQGTVWGTDVYTADSALCRAALHAGRVDANGGTITAEFRPARDRYVGSERNGVTTHDYGGYGASIAFR